MWKWILIEGNFFIISRIINCITSQFLIINFKSGSKNPALSKAEFIVTGIVITMFLVKLVSLINIAHSLKSFAKSLKSSCEEELCFSLGFLTMVSSKQIIFFPFFNLLILSIWFYPNNIITNNITASAFSIFSNMI